MRLADTSASARAARASASVAIAAAGAAIAAAVGIPVPWIVGSTIAVALAALSGFDVYLPMWLRNVAFFVLGVQAGSGVNPRTLELIALWPLSFAVLMVGVAAVTGVTWLLLHKGLGWDRKTAFFAGLPGALSFVLAAAADTNADMKRVTIIQTVRLLVLIAVLVPVLAWLGGNHAAAPVSSASWQFGRETVILLGAGLVGALVGHFSRFPGGMMLGALLASAILHGTAAVSGPLPREITIAGSTIVGILIGGRLKADDRVLLFRLLPAAILAFVLGLGTAGLSALTAWYLLGTAFPKLALAYAPGALEAMIVIAFSMNIDPAFVAAHHVVRFLGIALFVPLTVRWLAGGEDKARAG